MNRITGSGFQGAALLLVVLGAVSLACNGGEPEGSPPAPAPAQTGEASGPAPTDSGEVGAAPADAAALQITPFGVPECDNYVKAYLACVEGRVQGEQKQQLLDSMAANQTKWRALASMREGAIALSLACRTAAQKSKEAMTVDYGCEF